MNMERLGIVQAGGAMLVVTPYNSDRRDWVPLCVKLSLCRLYPSLQIAIVGCNLPALTCACIDKDRDLTSPGKSGTITTAAFETCTRVVLGSRRSRPTPMIGDFLEYILRAQSTGYTCGRSELATIPSWKVKSVTGEEVEAR